MDQSALGILITLGVVAGLFVLASLVGVINVMIGGEFQDGFVGFFRELIWFIGMAISEFFKVLFSSCASSVLVLVVAGFLITRL